MATITFNGESYTVDHAVKGTDYVHGYDADGVMVCCITGVVNFDAIGFDGTYMSPSACLEEACNDVAYINSTLKTKSGGSVAAPAAPYRGITANYTLKSADAGYFMYVNSESAITVTIPTNDTAPMPTGTEIEVCRWGAGAVTFAAATNVSIVSVGSGKTISDRYGCVALKKLNTNLWLLAGALE